MSRKRRWRWLSRLCWSGRRQPVPLTRNTEHTPSNTRKQQHKHGYPSASSPPWSGRFLFWSGRVAFWMGEWHICGRVKFSLAHKWANFTFIAQVTAISRHGEFTGSIQNGRFEHISHIVGDFLTHGWANLLYPTWIGRKKDITQILGDKEDQFLRPICDKADWSWDRFLIRKTDFRDWFLIRQTDFRDRFLIRQTDFRDRFLIKKTNFWDPFSHFLIRKTDFDTDFCLGRPIFETDFW